MVYWTETETNGRLQIKLNKSLILIILEELFYKTIA